RKADERQPEQRSWLPESHVRLSVTCRSVTCRCASLSVRPDAGGELPFPVQGARDDQLEVVEARLPAERRADLVRLRDEHRRIARPPRGPALLERSSPNPLDGREQLPHAAAPHA